MDSAVIVPKGTEVLWGVRCVDTRTKGPSSLYLTKADAWWLANKASQDINTGRRPRHEHEIYAVPKSQWPDRYRETE